LKNLIRYAIRGDVTAIAHLISLAEAAGETALEVQNEIFPHGGRAHLLGITGPAGAGKSTLISKLAAKLAISGRKVGVIACDPSSPNTGGALLGDRIRMNDLVHDPRIFIRSIATRDSAGGLPLAAFRAADILDASGFGTVIIETVGTGQNQVDIMQAAHTIIAVSAPGLGDDIQAMKSGLLEVADIHVVNKSDLHGAGKTLMDIENAVRMRQKNTTQDGATRDDGQGDWAPVVLPVNSLTGEGVDELQQAVEAHYRFLQDGDNMQQRCRRMFRERVYTEAIDMLAQSFKASPDEHLSRRIEQMLQREITPTRAAQEFLKNVL
jgi:LAO/AO transport system kinase